MLLDELEQLSFRAKLEGWKALRTEIFHIEAVLSSTDGKTRRFFVPEISFHTEEFQVLQAVERLGDQAHANRSVSPELFQELEVQNEVEVHFVDLF